MLSEGDAWDLVNTYSSEVNEGRPIRQIIAEDANLSARLGRVDITEGKVSDSVYGGNLVTPDGVRVRLMYRTNRISTHDRNRGAIPFKDQVLAANHDYMLGIVKPFIGTSQFDIRYLKPTSTVIAAEDLDMIDFENVMRQYMAEGSTDTSLYMAWRKASEAKQEQFAYAGHNFVTSALSPNCLLEELLFTPSTKSHEHDQTVSLDYLTDNGILTPEELTAVVYSSRQGFNAVAQVARRAKMLLVDTKTEHGRTHDGRIVSGDELYTLDSSRYWLLDDNDEILIVNGKPVSVSKEFARGMVKGADDQFSPEQAREIAVRYIMGLQHLTGEEFKPDLRPRENRIIESTHLILDELDIS